MRQYVGRFATRAGRQHDAIEIGIRTDSVFYMMWYNENELEPIIQRSVKFTVDDDHGYGFGHIKIAKPGLESIDL